MMKNKLTKPQTTIMTKMGERYKCSVIALFQMHSENKVMMDFMVLCHDI